MPVRRVLLDTNIILDVLLDREPFVTDAQALFEAIENQRVEGYVTATTLTDIFYIVRKSKGIQTAKEAVSRLLATMKICPVNRRILQAAILSNLNDFEDAVQLVCATSLNLDAIVTRDSADFAGSTIPIFSAGELLQNFPENEGNSD
jgi:predicted nucleic acid-binding protein